MKIATNTSKKLREISVWRVGFVVGIYVGCQSVQTTWTKSKTMNQQLSLMFVLMLSLIGHSQGAAVQSFDSDPGWTSFNLPSNGNAFGFSNTNFAGASAGEIGGTVSDTDSPSWYGDNSIAALTGNDAMSASGLLNTKSLEPNWDHGILIGHFDNDGFITGAFSRFNGIGLQIAEKQNTVVPTFRVFYVAGTFEGSLFEISGLDESRTWSYSYDPDGGTFGSFDYSVSGAGGTSGTHFLTEVERNSIGTLDTFGLSTKAELSTDLPKMEFYVDNVSYTGFIPEPSTFVLAALALLSLGMTRRRRQRA